MVRYCSYPGCFNNNKTAGLSFHRFPKDKLWRQKWLTAAGIRDWNPGAFTLLCSVHFKKCDFHPNLSNGRHLWANAVPSIFSSCTQTKQGHGREGHLPERPRVDDPRTSLSENRKHSKCGNAAFIDPTQFMAVTMVVGKEALEISNFSPKISQKQNIWRRESSRRLFMAVGQVSEVPRLYKQMQFIANSQAFFKAPSTKARSKNVSPFTESSHSSLSTIAAIDQSL